MTIAEVDRTPVPRPDLPEAEQLARFNADPYGYLDELAGQLGHIFALRLGTLGNEPIEHIAGNGDWVFLTRPHHIKIMYEADWAQASGALANKVFFGTDEASVAYIEGTPHRQRRSQVQKLLSTDYSAIVLDVLERSVATWPRNTPFPLFRRLQEMTVQVITEVVCGDIPQSDLARIRELLLRTEDARRTRQEIVEADRAVRSVIAGHIDGYRQANNRDVMAALITLSDQGDDSLTDDIIRDEVFGLLYTGFSTTANTLSWTLLRIFDDERVHRLLCAEIADVLGDEPVTRDNVAGLTYLDAVIKETLRLHPVTPLNGVRMARRTMNIDGHVIAPGTILVHCAYLLQRSPEVFTDPTRFIPERFVDHEIDQYRWGAFGGGNRTCVGRSFSLWEMKIVLAKLLSTCRMQRTGGIPLARQQGFFLAPADEARMTLLS